MIRYIVQRFTRVHRNPRLVAALHPNLFEQRPRTVARGQFGTRSIVSETENPVFACENVNLHPALLFGA